MDEASRSISKNQENGQYYIDAKNWYATKYLYPVTEKSVLVLLTSFFIGLVLLAVIFNLSKSNNSISGENYLQYVKDNIKSKPIIKSLGEKGNPQTLLEDYLIKFYVTEREKYNFNSVDRQIEVIKNNSNFNEFNSFSRYMSLNNPTGPRLKYENNISRVIIINEVRHIGDGEALVEFDAQLWNNRNGSSSSNKFVSKIKYKISKISELIESKSKRVDFSVIGYSSSQKS